MKQIKAGKQLVSLVELCYKADQPLLLVGRHGVGKSQIIEQAAAELDIGFICRDLSLMEPPDLVGMPKLEERVTRYFPPAFLPTDGEGLLVFEELNRCPNYMRAPCLQLLTARCLNDYVLPKGWLPVAAINPPGESYEVQELDEALLSRFVKVQVVPDKGEWLAWARSKNLDEGVQSYVNSDPKIFMDTSPRDWYKVSKVLQAEKILGAGALVCDLAVAGLVGRERAAAFKTFLRGGPKPPPIEVLLKNYGEYQPQVRRWREQGQTDMLETLCHSLKVYLQVPDNWAVISGARIAAPQGAKITNEAKKISTAFGAFLVDLPPDMREEVLIFLKKHYGEQS